MQQITKKTVKSTSGSVSHIHGDKKNNQINMETIKMEKKSFCNISSRDLCILILLNSYAKESRLFQYLLGVQLMVLQNS